jgi:hypothetical protein
MKDNFNPEKMGIPYDEIARIHANMDIQEQEIQRRQREAEKVFKDLKEFFEGDHKWLIYLSAVISKQNVEKVLMEIEEIFVEVEDYEKCSLIKKWKEQTMALPEDI